MRKSILYFLLLSAGFWSCENKDESVFEKTTDERLNEALGAYEKQLSEAAYGWNAVVYPGNESSYGFYMKFDDKNRVSMYSDFTETSAKTPKESSYRLKAMQTPTLIFDTYGYMHLLADPDGGVNGGNDGDGLLSDFEFAIYPDSVTTDRIVFVGRKNQSKLILTRATQAQQTAFNGGGQAAGLAFNNISKYQVYFKRLTFNGVTYEIAVNQVDRIIKLTWLDGTTVRTFTTTYYYDSEGLVFAKPFVNGSNTINGFNKITWDESRTQLSVSVNGTTSVIGTAIRPLSIDRAAPRAWWNAPQATGGEWRSVSGFHVNGVDDAFGLKTLTSDSFPYVVYLYIPAYGSGYDLFAPAFFEDGGLSLHYGDAVRTPNFTSDGRIIFSMAGTLGDVPKTGPVAQMSAQLYESSGYYLIQTSEKTYDMVSVKDAKSWISWFRI
ncbi:DUF4302 domain-containing protein [Dyadobacter sp. CY312]|uniref:DUF4302 domain-containing protein n=1 Tax=Dyadobacter sp. CY312 TaxID=2907303 RepID=UPI001F228BB4|nr:DUF4302 domain-containing protein [Dyadobacter sp. CY312]MCE7040560.1 DUF4302 domain-containing protein [Dyadobacter sp. CY312]